MLSFHPSNPFNPVQNVTVLYAFSNDRTSTRIILNFFDWVIRLPKLLKNRIKAYIMKTEEENKMEYVPIWERDWERKVERGERRGIKLGKERGIKLGEDTGITKEKLRTAGVMYDDGLSLETIAKYTGLSQKEIKNLIRDRQHD